MTKMHRLRDMTSSGVFPSYEMIVSLNEELGVAVTYEDFEDHQDEADDSESLFFEVCTIFYSYKKSKHCFSFNIQHFDIFSLVYKSKYFKTLLAFFSSS